MTRREDALDLAGFLVLVVLIGTNLVAIRLVNRELAPFWNAGLRFALAAAVFVILGALRGRAWPDRPEIAGAAVYGVLAFALFFGFIYVGLVHASAGLGQTVLALGPLLTLLMAVAVGLERLRPVAAVGAVVALAGVAVSFGVRDPAQTPLPSMLALIAGALSFAAGGIVVKRLPAGDPLVRNTIATSVGAALLLTASAFIGESWALPTTADTWVALLYLVGPGTIVVFSLFLYLLGRWPATRVSYQFVLAPIVAIVLDSWVLAEPVSTAMIAGSALVIGGVYLGAFLRTA